MKKTLLTLNALNLNGRTYPTDVVKKACEEYIAKGTPIVVHREFQTRGHDVNLEAVCATVEDLEFTETELKGTIKMFPGEEALLSLECRPSFIGTINPNGVVTEARLVAFNFTADPA